jgi:DNA uptake protein ComE-like DNA-binding protein
MMISVLGISIISMTNIGNMVASNQLTASRAFYIAEAGIERAVRAIRDDTSTTQTANPAADGYCAIICLDGYQYTGAGGSNYDYALFYGSTDLSSTTNHTATNRYCTLNSTNDYVIAYDFQQRFNLMGTPILSMEIGIRVSKSSSGGTDPVLQLSYTLNGSSYTNVGSPITVSNSAWGAPQFFTISPTPAWSALNGTNFRIRATQTNTASRNSSIDYLCIRITAKIDAITEPWYATFKNASGNPVTVNIPLSSGVVESAPIDDEHGKVHLNYASQSLLHYLMFECGIADATANTLATNIVTYRGSNWFDTVEELQQVSGMTTAYYDLIKDYVTVYSWVNSNVQRTTGSRAPININTAQRQVLEAVFDPLGLGASDPATLASAIITRRATTPFSSMISSNPADTSSGFARFLDTQTAYLSAAEISYIRENCDASLYNRTRTASWNNSNVTTTEFCYSSKVYSVTSTGKVQNAYRITKRVFEDDGTFTITSGALTLNYWKELVP